MPPTLSATSSRTRSAVSQPGSSNVITSVLIFGLVGILSVVVVFIALEVYRLRVQTRCIQEQQDMKLLDHLVEELPQQLNEEVKRSEKRILQSLQKQQRPPQPRNARDCFANPNNQQMFGGIFGEVAQVISQAAAPAAAKEENKGVVIVEELMDEEEQEDTEDKEDEEQEDEEQEDEEEQDETKCASETGNGGIDIATPKS